MNFNSIVSPRIFKAIQNVDINELSKCSAQEIRPILPCLVRMSLISPLDNTKECAEGRKEILTLLSGIEHVNSIVALLSIDFHALESDVKKEQQLRQKLGSSQSDSILVQSLQNGLALEFERSDSTRRLRLVLSELLFISSQWDIRAVPSHSPPLLKLLGTFDQRPPSKAHFEVACLIVRKKKPYTIAEDLVKLGAVKMAEIMCGQKEAKKLNSVPLSARIVKERISILAEYVKEQVIFSLKQAKHYAIQLDETTDASSNSHLMVYVRYKCTRAIEEELLFCSPLELRARGIDVYNKIHEQQRGQDFYVKHSDLFDNAVYIEEICDVLCIALAELPAVLNILDTVETLLHIKNGPEIICWVVANSPDCFREVCTGLIANGERQEEDNVGGRTRTQALSMLCQMNPSQALAIRAKCVELCRLPGLAITLSLEHSGRTLGADAEGDMVAFVSGLLLGNDQQVRSWFALFVRNGQKRKWESHTALQLLRDELLRRLQTIILFSLDSQLPDSFVVQASALLRLYCALRGIAAIKFQEEEVSLIVQLLTSHPPPSPAGVRFVSLGLCMLIACPSLISQAEHEKRSIEWVQWLVKEEAYFESSSGVTASFGEMLLLMAIHFHSNQMSPICELVCSTLGMKVQIRSNNMTRMKQIFTQEIFTEQVVTSHAVKVPVTASLNANIPGFLPIHCIHQLLKSRAFTKHRVPIKDWIYKQICSSVPPLHPVLPALVEVYVNSILVPSSKAPLEHTNQPLAEDEIRRVFQNSVFGNQFDAKSDLGGLLPVGTSTSTSSLTSQLLLLYYLLLYEDIRLTNMHSHFLAGRKVKSYSAEFLSELPIKYLLQQAQKDQQSYAGLFSPLLKLLATHFPHLSLVDDWLDELTIDHSEAYYQVTITDVVIQEAFSHISTCPSRTGRLLKQLLSMPATDVWPFAETIIHQFKSLLDENVPRYIQELYKKLWLRLNTVLPRCLWVMTTNALLHEDANIKNAFLTQEKIILDPLQVLRCDSRVFRCASVLSIVQHVLEASLAASRSQLARHLQDSPVPNTPGEGEREDLRKALVAAQESLAVQILLEACLPTKDDKEKPGQLWALREVRSLVCSFLHQVFIADPSLAKLVHFQGYPRELLPVTVPGIPSMHICLDFIPELLSQPSLEKQVFAVDLVSHLAIQYALPKSLSVARLAINTLSTLLGVLPNMLRTQLFLPVLPALVRICEAFPPLVDDTVSLLMQLGRICMSEASLMCSRDVSTNQWTMPCDEDKLRTQANDALCQEVKQTFDNILKKAVLKTRIY